MDDLFIGFYSRIAAIVGSFLAAALLSGYGCVVARDAHGPPLLTRSDRIGGAVVVGLATVLLVVVLRAWWRVLRHRRTVADVPDFDWIALAVPLLLAAGVGFGGWAGQSIADTALQYERKWPSLVCERSTYWGYRDGEGCSAQAWTCRTGAWRAPLPFGSAKVEALFEVLAKRARDADAAAMTAARASRFYDGDVSGDYERLIEYLRDGSDLDRAAMVCLYENGGNPPLGLAGGGGTPIIR